MYNFFDKNLKEKREYLIELFNSVADVKPIYSKLLSMLSSDKVITEEQIDNIYKLVEQARSENDKSEKENSLDKLRKIHKVISDIHKEEEESKDKNIDGDLESKLLNL